MDLTLRIILLLTALGIGWWINSEKNRVLQKLESAYKDKNERLIGELSQKNSQYANYLGGLGLLTFALLAYVLEGMNGA